VPPEYRFDIHASIVFQLGEDLITDVVQALIELAKNSYDADADFANIIVATDRDNDVPETFYPDARGIIIVEDNGLGMDEDAIRRGWLTISNSLKREMKRSKKTTPEKHRTPLGDKGLGRLGVQRLGHNVEIFTKPKGEDCEYHIGWSWKDFVGENTLGHVKLHFEKTPSRRKRGTMLLISELRDPEYWQDKDTFEEFELKVSQLISPYAHFQDFKVAATVNGKELKLAEISTRIRRLAQLQYKVDFDGDALKVHGKASLNFLRPASDRDAIAAFELLAARDNGDSFFEFLSSHRLVAPFKLRRAKSASWFVEFSQNTDFSDVPDLRFDLETAPTTAGERLPASPGPFHAEIDAFDLSLQTASEQSAFNSTVEYRKYIKNLSGVRIFRDGFGVRVDREWLGLGKQWTGAGSYYALKPENTMGFVALTAKDNACLVETTDREGFKSTPHFDNFLALFGIVVKFAHDAQEFLRRGWLDYVKEHQRQLAEITASETPEDLQKQLDAGLSKARQLAEPLAKADAALVELRHETTETLGRAQASLSSQEAKELKSLAATIKRRLDETEAVLAKVKEFVAETTQLREVSLVLQNEMHSLRIQLEETYEVVSLGLTAEALSHEILNVADQMAQRTQDIVHYINRKEIADSRLFAYIEYIKTSVAALRKQMAHLAPSLKYVREQRPPLDIASFFHEVREYYDLRWVGERLRLNVRARGEALVLNINRGKLTQIFDNLILNSEYWLREYLRTKRIDEGIITIDVSNPIVRVSDNGPGIDPVIETTLFEPFVTKKPKQKGRGLGLFIVRQLLETEACSISLSSKRNDRGRLFQFQIDFSGAINGSE
jgi:signal transduction histidine kinase